MRTPTIIALTTVLAGLALAACKPLAAEQTTSTAAAATTAQDQLATLTVRAEDTGAHYNRDAWGDWTRQAGSCTTRHIVLQRQGTDVTTSKTGCKITGGTWVSPYDNARTANPAEIQIDHRVPVKEAARSGARTWDRATRERFYNDLSNLVAVSAKSNTSKGDRDPGRWRPTDRAAWCGYASAYIATKTTYGLTVDRREHDGLAALLRTCR